MTCRDVNFKMQSLPQLNSFVVVADMLCGRPAQVDCSSSSKCTDIYTCLQRKLIQCVVYDTSGIVLVSNKSSKVY
jgi:hypothetical protein